MKLKPILKWSIRVIFVALLLSILAVFITYWRSTNDCDRKTALVNPMKAIRFCEYGSPDDVLKIEEVEKPVPNDNQILVRVRAVSLRFFDGGMLRGGIGRLVFGLRKPKNTCPGSDFSGTVEAIGRNVTEFKPGDEVFGVRAGALAEYICVRLNGAMVSKPGNVTFEQAASIPTALTALQGLRDTGRVKAGQKILINGASGGVGTFAVQIAKAFGAEVTGVCSTANLDLVRSIGADHVVDYTVDDFTRSGQRYDLIVNAVDSRSSRDLRRALTPDGKVVLVAGHLRQLLGGVVLGPFMKKRLLPLMANVKRDDLLLLKDMVDTGKLTPVIDRTYALSE